LCGRRILANLLVHDACISVSVVDQAGRMVHLTPRTMNTALTPNLVKLTITNLNSHVSIDVLPSELVVLLSRVIVHYIIRAASSIRIDIIANRFL
jgi:hypothetical protein